MILVYDVSSRESFEGVEKWHQKLSQLVEGNVEKVVAGNKKDVE